MYDLIVNFIGYSGTTSIHSTIVYTCCVLLLLGFTLTVDMLYKMFLRFLPADSK